MGCVVCYKDRPCKYDINLSKIDEKVLRSHAAGNAHLKNFIAVLFFGVFLIQGVWWYILVYFCYKKFCDMVYFVFSFWTQAMLTGVDVIFFVFVIIC